MEKRKIAFYLSIGIIACMMAFTGGWLAGHNVGVQSLRLNGSKSSNTVLTSNQISEIGYAAVYNYTNNLNNTQLVHELWRCNGLASNSSVLLSALLIRPIRSDGSVVNFSAGLLRNISLVSIVNGNAIQNCTFQTSGKVG